jgi:hypothetical protein
VVAAAVVLAPGAPLLAKTLTVNVIATLLMAPALLLLFLLVNDREIKGAQANGWRTNPGRRNNCRGDRTRWCALQRHNGIS